MIFDEIQRLNHLDQNVTRLLNQFSSILWKQITKVLGVSILLLY